MTCNTLEDIFLRLRQDKDFNNSEGRHFLMIASTSMIHSWPTRVVESNGDYRNETYLETLIGGPLYENQKNLPRLPIPSVSDTLKRFLPTALPLARNEEEKEALKEACRQFPELANELHERLQQRRNEEFPDSSWLQQWWNQV